MAKKVLLINDLAGYGKVALAAMLPVLSYLKYETYNLPTAIVSNTLDYGKFDILDTTQYMKNTLRVWKELDFRFDAISTGFIVSQEQTQMVTDFCRENSAKGVTVFTDPIMGDDGRLYNGMSEETVELMRKLVSVADYIVPNYTEACYLTGTAYEVEGVSEEAYRKMIDALRTLGAKSVVITSAVVKDSDKKSVVGYDHKEGKYFRIDFEEIPVRFPGTGDIFSAVFMAKILAGENLHNATQKAMDAVRTMIAENTENVDKFKGIPLETCLYLKLNGSKRNRKWIPSEADF